MFRLVVIHQLVLSLLAGPMLCCCTTARLGHDATPDSRTSASADRPRRKHCCVQSPKPTDAGRPRPSGEQPDDPAKCPCKDASANAAVSGVPAGSAHTLGLLLAGMITLDLPDPMVALSDAIHSSAQFEVRSCSPSTADLLYAHHRLRC